MGNLFSTWLANLSVASRPIENDVTRFAGEGTVRPNPYASEMRGEMFTSFRTQPIVQTRPRRPGWLAHRTNASQAVATPHPAPYVASSAFQPIFKFKQAWMQTTGPAIGQLDWRWPQPFSGAWAHVQSPVINRKTQPFGSVQSIAPQFTKVGRIPAYNTVPGSIQLVSSKR